MLKIQGVTQNGNARKADRQFCRNRKPGPVKDYVIVIDENDRIVKEYDDGRVEYIPEGSSGDG